MSDLNRNYRRLLKTYWIPFFIYLVATSMTRAPWIGDTVGYARAIEQARFDDFGHFLWLPLGWLASRALGPFAEFAVGSNERLKIVWTLMLINWLAGLAVVLMIYDLSRRMVTKLWIALISSTAVVFTHGFLISVHSGNSYVPGLALLCVGLSILLSANDRSVLRWRTPLAAGTALAISVSLWVPFVYAIPAALVSPILVYGRSRQHLVLAGRTTLVMSVVAATIFVIGATFLGIHTVGGLLAWVESASHGLVGNNGIPRMALGFSRSFINVGDDGVLFKRFLVGDPFNPVTVFDLARRSAWKIGLFYFFIGSMLLTLSRTAQGRRLVALWFVNAIPVLGFGLMWQGGDLERYMALYPVTYVGLAHGLSGDRSRRWFLPVTLAFVGATSVASMERMARPAVARQEDKALARLKDLMPLLKAESLVCTINQQDPVWSFTWNFPFHPLNRDDRLNTYNMIEPGTSREERWREEFAAHALDTWRRGGDVWITVRVQSAKPQFDWVWAEGGDSVSWTDITGLFARLQLGEPVGADDGFALLLPSVLNQEAVRELVPSHVVARGFVSGTGGGSD